MNNDNTTTQTEKLPHMDWQQVALNGGPPCFFVEGPQFCGRAEQWEGHGNPAFHNFVSLAQWLKTAPPASEVEQEIRASLADEQQEIEAIRERAATNYRHIAGEQYTPMLADIRTLLRALNLITAFWESAEKELTAAAASADHPPRCPICGSTNAEDDHGDPCLKRCRDCGNLFPWVTLHPLYLAAQSALAYFRQGVDSENYPPGLVIGELQEAVSGYRAASAGVEQAQEEAIRRICGVMQVADEDVRDVSIVLRYILRDTLAAPSTPAEEKCAGHCGHDPKWRGMTQDGLVCQKPIKVASTREHLSSSTTIPCGHRCSRPARS